MDISEKENSSIETTNTVEEKNMEDIEKLIDSVVHNNLSQKVIMA